MRKVRFAFLYYNGRLDLLGERLSINGMQLVYAGDRTGFRIFTSDWEQIGFI